MPQTQLTDEVAEAICQEIARGTPVALAAQIAGFTARAFFKWQSLGNADIEDGKGGRVDRNGEITGGTVHARLVHRLALARARMAAPLVDAATEGARKGTDIRGVLSVLKTFLPAHFGDRALEVQAQVEMLAEQPQVDDRASAGPAYQVVATARCGACGAEQLEGKRYCGDCAAPMAAAPAASEQP
jgi:hypothetical protein